ncbi:MAG: TauD/TfdA family dioxygenase, partial [Halieaceae bacterium]|nr:TauD/TfdA family dioxygenase [Halieaceae bacterium]
MIIKPSGKSLGATITDVELNRPLSNEAISLIRDAWLEYHVISFPEQFLDHDQLVKFSLALGPFGEDPFI